MGSAPMRRRETTRPLESESTDQPRAPSTTYWPTGYPSSEMTSHNRRWTPRAYFLPCTPGRDNACTFPHGRKSNTSANRERGSSAHLLTAESFARYQKTSAAANSRWEAETARMEKRRRREKCSRRCDQRCTADRP